MDADRFKSNAMLEKAIGHYQEVLELPDVPKTLLILSGRKCSERQAFRGESPTITYYPLCKTAASLCVCVPVCLYPHFFRHDRRTATTFCTHLLKDLGMVRP